MRDEPNKVTGLRHPEQRGEHRMLAFPRTCTPQLIEKITVQLMRGKSLRAICNCGDNRFPTFNTVIKWLAQEADFREAYYQARRVSAELRIDEIFDIADDTSNDYMDVEVPLRNGESYTKTVVNTEAINRSKVRIETRKWYAQKMIPKLYGDKTTQEHTATGDLAKLLGSVINRDKGLPGGRT